MVDRFHTTRDLGVLEHDVGERYGQRILVTDNFVNIGGQPRDEAGWPTLVDRFDSDAGVRRLEEIVLADLEFLDALGLETYPTSLM